MGVPLVSVWFCRVLYHHLMVPTSKAHLTTVARRLNEPVWTTCSVYFCGTPIRLLCLAAGVFLETGQRSDVGSGWENRKMCLEAREFQARREGGKGRKPAVHPRLTW